MVKSSFQEEDDTKCHYDKNVVEKSRPRDVLFQKLMEPILQQEKILLLSSSSESEAIKIAKVGRIAVHESYRNRGISKKVFALSLYLLHKKGYQWFAGIFTNPYSIHSIMSILPDTKKEEQEKRFTNEIKYENFVYNNNNIFTSLEGKAIYILTRTILNKPYENWAEEKFKDLRNIF